MTHDEAKHLLFAHCVPLEPHGELLAADEGFLPSLRPYRGHLVEKNFHQVMEALLTLGEMLRGPQVDREVMSHLWTICYLGRSWGLEPDGMLRRNNLIEQAEIQRLERWISIIESTVQALLSQIPLHHSFNEYTGYLIEIGWWDNVEFFVPLLASAITDVQVAHLTSRPAIALGLLGARAQTALPALRAALTQPYELGPQVHNAGNWINGIREEIRRAIQQIEATTTTG